MIKKGIFVFLLLCLPGVASFGAATVNNPQKLPKSVIEYVEQHCSDTKYPYNVYFVMKWNGHKIYRITTTRKGIHTTGLPYYILYNGKVVRRPFYKDYIWIELKEKNWI